MAEQREPTNTLLKRLRLALARLLEDQDGPDSVVWAHNQGLGRNLLLARELQLACRPRGVRLIFHHHDWWFDNRWERWPEMRRHGFRTVAAVAKVIFGSAAGVGHVAINQADARILSRDFPRNSAWIPNPIDARPVTRAAKNRARSWCTETLGDAAPVWLMPCRLIRRKNIAEALLLTRWLRPEAWLVTTGDISSKGEKVYASRLAHAALNHRWRLRLGILQSSSTNPPSVFELMSASEAVLLTSLQEGFGLSYLEAPALERPLIARRLPNIAPDLARFGFHFPQHYPELLIDPALFDWLSEQRRQRRLYARWRGQLPAPCRRLAAAPWLLRCSADRPSAVPFSRLTLTAQLEVLKAPLSESWARCIELNPFLLKWRVLAERRALEVTSWPRGAGEWLGAPAYVRQLQSVMESQPARLPPDACTAAQEAFIREKLTTENLYPLNWSPNT